MNAALRVCSPPVLGERPRPLRAIAADCPVGPPRTSRGIIPPYRVPLITSRRSPSRILNSHHARVLPASYSSRRPSRTRQSFRGPEFAPLFCGPQSPAATAGRRLDLTRESRARKADIAAPPATKLFERRPGPVEPDGIFEDARPVLGGFPPALKRRYRADKYAFKVRDKAHPMTSFSDSLSHNAPVPRSPSFGPLAFQRTGADILTGSHRERPPGEFPFRGRPSSRLKRRRCEEPGRACSRVRAAPKRTNKRSTMSLVLPAGSALSTAKISDCVTLYGEDPDRWPRNIYGRSQQRRSPASRTWTTRKISTRAFRLAGPRRRACLG